MTTGKKGGEKKADPVEELAGEIIAVLEKMNETEETHRYILADLEAGRRGWYHELLLCYIDEGKLAEHGVLGAIRAARRLGIDLPGDAELGGYPRLNRR